MRKFLLFIILTIPGWGDFVSSNDQMYLGAIESSLKSAEESLMKDDFCRAYLFYDMANTTNGFVTMHDISYDTRIKVGMALVKMFLDKSEASYRLLIVSFLQSIEYKDGKAFIMIEKLAF